MQKIEDVALEPGIAELVVSEAKEVSGLDLLGLRAPAEAVANRLINGVTTVTPAIRYFSVRAWLTLRYLKLGGLKSWDAFTVFAAKVESAIAYAGQIAKDPTPGLVGRDGATTELSKLGTTLTLKRLTKILAINVYGGPAEALGLGEGGGEVPTLTSQRGVPLAEAFGAQLEEGSALNSISLGDEEQELQQEQLAALGQVFSIAKPSANERQVLIDALVPKLPRKGDLGAELNRIASYCLLLHLSKTLGRAVLERDVFEAASQPSLDAIPEELHVICDGWVQFAVRDLLVMVHEAAVANVLRELSQGQGSEKRQPSKHVVWSLASQNLESGLSGLGLPTEPDQPISDLYSAVNAVIGLRQDVRGICRWSGHLSESLLLEHQHWMSSADGLGLLPVAWIIAAQRLEPGIRSEDPRFQLDVQAGVYRIGVGAVVLPEVKLWVNSPRTVRELTAWLIQRSVDQHLRIAWSRLAREPYKDVGLLRSDGDDWVFQKEFEAGRATSRLYQAVNWLRQLELVNDSGITDRGSQLLAEGLVTLRDGLVN
jgi:hypothetical protein